VTARRKGAVVTCRCGHFGAERECVIVSLSRSGVIEVQHDGETPHVCTQAATAPVGRPRGVVALRLPLTEQIRERAAKAQIEPEDWCERAIAAAAEAEPCWICGSTSRCPCEGPPAYRPDPE
jgi:hypothetical protein